MPDDRLTAALEEIRGRNEWRIAFHRYTDYTVEHDVPEGDVRRLLAALDAVLEQHETKPYYLAASECEHPEPSDDADEWTEWDSDHPPGTGDVGRICLLTQIASYCPGCTEMTYGDEPCGEEYVPAPCGTRAAITRELTGEGNADGQ